MSSCHTEALGIIGLADETGTEEQGRREENSEALLGKKAFPRPIELTALLHVGPFPVPGAAGQTDKVLGGLSAAHNTCTRGDVVVQRAVVSIDNQGTGGGGASGAEEEEPGLSEGQTSSLST